MEKNEYLVCVNKYGTMFGWDEIIYAKTPSDAAKEKATKEGMLTCGQAIRRAYFGDETIVVYADRGKSCDGYHHQKLYRMNYRICGGNQL